MAAHDNSSNATNKGDCFVVMPYGRTDDEIDWFAGWYKECIAKGIHLAGYNPILAAAEHKPSAINDDIRAHLVFDPMVICDLGGVSPDDDPNPNVMYELGIRHAFGHPLVILAWKNQKLPFDVANQRVIMSDRRFLDIQQNIAHIVDYIAAAERGDYYRPMDAIRRAASLDIVAVDRSRDSVLRSLIQEVSTLRETIQRPASKKEKHSKKIATHHSQIFHAIGTAQRRNTIAGMLESRGITNADFKSILTHSIPPDLLPSARTWDVETWTNYLIHRINGSTFIQAPNTNFSAQQESLFDKPFVEAPIFQNEELEIDSSSSSENSTVAIPIVIEPPETSTSNGESPATSTS